MRKDETWLDLAHDYFESQTEPEYRFVHLYEICYSLRSENLKFSLPPVHRHGLEQSQEANHMIPVHVSNENDAFLVESQSSFVDRSLATLAAVKDSNDVLVGDGEA